MQQQRRLILCTAVIILFAGCAPQPADDTAPPARPNVLLITVDTLRPDRLGAYGYDRPTSPNLDALAEEGVLFTDAVTPSSWTLPSTLSIMTGLYPSSHGVEHFSATLHPDVPTLASLLRDVGYQTYGAISHAVLDPAQFHTDRGLDTVNYYELTHWEISSERYTNDAIQWLDQRPPDGNTPWFAWLHYFDPHYSYVPQKDFEEFYTVDITKFDPKDYDVIDLKKLGPDALSEEEYRYLSDLYDAEIAYTDHHIGRLLDYLREQNMLDDTIVVVTSDHGESLGDQGLVGHTQVYYDSVARVPLILRVPAALPEVRKMIPRSEQINNAPVVTVDIVPTLLDWLDIPAPTLMEGQNLLQIPQWDERFRMTETNKIGEDAVSFAAGRRGDWKLVVDRILEDTMLFSLPENATEVENLLPQGRDAARTLGCTMEQWTNRITRRRVPQESGIVDDAHLEQLRSLGYIGGGGSVEATEGLVDLLAAQGLACATE